MYIYIYIYMYIHIHTYIHKFIGESHHPPQSSNSNLHIMQNNAIHEDVDPLLR